MLTFDFGGGNAAFVPQDYGDRVTATTQGSYSYGVTGEGFTPNVVLDYAANVGAFNVWNNGYGELVNALGHSAFDVPGQIVLTPEPGYSVTLSSSQVAGWNGSSYQSEFRIWDDNGSFDSPNLFFASMLVPGAHSIVPLTSALNAVGALHLYSNEWGSIGIDNVVFSQSATVPLPAALPLLASACLGFGAALRRRWLAVCTRNR